MTERKSIRVIKRKEYQEIHIQLIPDPGETPVVFSRRIAEILNTYHATIIRATFLGKLSQHDITIPFIKTALSGVGFLYSWIEGDNCGDSFINGVYILAVSDLEVKQVVEGDRIVGSYFQTGEADYCFLGGIYSDPDLSVEKQAESIFASAKNFLEKAGFSYGNTVRTWFYLDGILDWYNDFNRVRTSFFNQNDIFNQLVAASTGIGGKNPRHSKVCLELNAIKPKSGGYIIEKVKSPMQCSAEEYGSAFSRAVRYSDSEYSSMTVSGTASINAEGKTLHEKDLRKQIELSFEVVMAIVDSQGFSIGDIVRGYAYCSEKSYRKTFEKYIKTSLPGNFSFICTENKICRDELMFEIELDVIKKNEL